MPGYTVKGFTYALKDEPLVSPAIKSKYKEYGWNYGDALHCRTRAVWDKEMLYLTVNRPSAAATSEEPFTIHTTIIDYSKKGLKPNAQKLYWRLQGEQNGRKYYLKMIIIIHISKHQSHQSLQIKLNITSLLHQIQEKQRGCLEQLPLDFIAITTKIK
jgi:hypothetical protein